MANVKVNLDYPIEDGMSLTFKAPCNCTEVTGLKVYYKELTPLSETDKSAIFIFKDAHGSTLTNIGNLFMSDSYVKVILDTTHRFAYIQNQDTNSYLEKKFSDIQSNIQNIKDFLFNDITGNQHSITFETLDGLIVTGVWNESLARLEC